MTMTFLGIPVEGDITKADKRTPQRPLEDLAPLMQAVLDDDGIAAFGWRQCTPYFNDGDPCVFSAYGVWFAPAEDASPDDADSEDDEYEGDDTEELGLYHGHLGTYEGGEWVKDPDNPHYGASLDGYPAI